MAKINREEIIGNHYQSKDWGKFVILSYEGKDEKGKHWYKIAFENGNEELVHWDTVRKGTAIDSRTRKLNKVKVEQIKRKQRNRLTKEKVREYKKFDFTGKTILSLDMSTTSTGWCLLNEKSIKNYGSISFDNKAKDHFKGIKNVKLYPKELCINKRLVIIFKGISELLTTHKPDIVLYEDCFLGASVTVLKALMKLQGFILGYCLMNNLEFECIMPPSWQNYFDINPLNTKEDSIRLAEKIIKVKTIDDIADAINIGIYGVKNLKE